MLNECIISPSIADRKISNFVFVPSTDPKITSLKIDNQYTGDCLYDVIKGLCEENNIGFKIVLTDENKFAFSLYAGVDRSYEQTENPYVVFSPNFENIRTRALARLSLVNRLLLRKQRGEDGRTLGSPGKRKQLNIRGIHCAQRVCRR